MQAIYSLVADEFSAVNELIVAELRSQVDLVEDISHYLVESGGKRIRPLVTLLSAGALSDNHNPLQATLAAAIEFLHTATLLHDDVVDTSSLRRGKPTANAQWGNAPSVLVGDFVYSRAFQLLVAIGSLPVMQVLSDTTVKIAEGEVKQLTEIGNTELNEQGYFKVIEYKTAQLFSGACHASALLAGAKPEIAEQLRQYGMHLGLAFQLVDDYLDYAGDASELGKNIGDDLAEGKLTLPLIHALRCTANTSNTRTELLEIINNRDIGRIERVLEAVQLSGSLGYTLDRAKKQASLCKAAIKSLKDSIYTRAMQELADFVVQRAH